MNEEYCMIYGSTTNNPGPFVLAVSKDQNMINGFREEHYHICKGGEICDDSRYETFASDYAIEYYMGHYMTQKMITDFCQYCTSVYNIIWGITDTIERELDYLKFDESDQNIIDDGFGILNEQMINAAPIELSDLVEQGHVYGSVLDIDACLDKFLSTYQPNGVF